MRAFLRRRCASVATLILAVGSIFMAAAPAHATAGDLTCTIQNVVATFQPALLPNGSSRVSGNDPSLSNCESLTGQTMTSGVGHINGLPATAEGLAAGNCPALITIDGNLRIDWDNNTNSKVAATLNTNPLNSTAILSLTVTNGSLEGDSIVPGIVITINTDCISIGLTTLNIPAGVVSFA